MIILHAAILAAAIGWAAWWLLREQWRYRRDVQRIDRRIKRVRRLGKWE